MQNFRIRDFLVAFTISLAMIVAGFTPVASFLRARTGTLVSPLQYGFYSFGTSLSSQMDFVRAVRNLDTQNTLLTKQVANLESELSEVQETRRENQVLREQLDVESDEARTLVMARVIGRGSADIFLLKLNRGSADGVEKDAAVVVQNFLVGVVEDVSRDFAFVRPVTDARLKIGALDQDSKDRARGVVRGQYSRLMIMETILAEEEVNPGDTIITSGEDSRFPKGIIIGKVSEVSGNGEGILKSATVVPGVDLDKVEEVFIITRGD